MPRSTEPTRNATSCPSSRCATRNTLLGSRARFVSHPRYMLAMFGRNPYRCGSHDSCSAQIFSTIGSTPGTSSGVAGRIVMNRFAGYPIGGDDEIPTRVDPHTLSSLSRVWPCRLCGANRRSGKIMTQVTIEHQSVTVLDDEMT